MPTDPTVTTKLFRIQTDPNASSNPVAQAYYEKTITLDGQNFAAPQQVVSWELHSQKTVTFNGVDYPYYLVSQLVVAIADQELANLTAPAPTV